MVVGVVGVREVTVLEDTLGNSGAQPQCSAMMVPVCGRALFPMKSRMDLYSRSSGSTMRVLYGYNDRVSQPPERVI